MISFACPGCGRVFQVRDKAAGSKARCSVCRHFFLVPTLARNKSMLTPPVELPVPAPVGPRVQAHVPVPKAQPWPPNPFRQSVLLLGLAVVVMPLAVGAVVAYLALHRDSPAGQRTAGDVAKDGEAQGNGEKKVLTASHKEGGSGGGATVGSTRTAEGPPKAKGPEERVAQALRDSPDAQCIAAAREVGRWGESGRPVSRALCEAATRDNADVRRAALEALEKVNPKLYHNVVPLLVDESPARHENAAMAIAASHEDLLAATPVLLAHLRWHAKQAGPLRPGRHRPFGLTYHLQDLAGVDLLVLRSVAADEPDVLKAAIPLARYTGPSDGARYPLPRMAISVLEEVGKAKPALRPQVVPALLDAMESHLTNEPRTRPRQLQIIRVLASFGPDAKPAVQSLRKLKLSPDAEIRDAVTKALAQIEGP